MEYRILGQTGMPVSCVGFGCWAIGGHGWGAVDDRESIDAIRRALDLGINLFDTADVYGFGHSEQVLGKALGCARRQVWVATKVGVRWDERGRTTRDCRPEYVLQALEVSLRRLGVDRIDLYQVHWPDPRTPIADTIETLRRCQESGKIAHIGCCNFSVEQLRVACGSGRIASIQSPYNLIDRRIERDLLPACTQLGIGVLAYSPLGQGFFSGRYGPRPRFQPDDVRNRSVYFRAALYRAHSEPLQRLKAIAARRGKTPAQVALRWVLQNRQMTSALVGMKTPGQAEEDAAVEWDLSNGEYAWLTASHQGMPEADVPPKHAETQW